MMESYLEPVKIAPEPIPIEKYVFSPVVPEVSMISNTKTHLDSNSEENVWKMKQEMQGSSECIRFESQQNFNPFGYKNLQAQFARKQVRFESPVLQPTPGLTRKSENPGTTEANKFETRVNYHDFSAIRKQSADILSKNPKSFEQIYMANIPDRKLDLSLIDLPNMANNMKNMNITDVSKGNDVTEKEIDKPSQKAELPKHDNELQTKSIENKENEMPTTYQHFLELQKKVVSKRKLHNDSITDIFNYKRNNGKNPVKHQTHVKDILLPCNGDSLGNSPHNADIQQKYDNFFDTGYQQFQSPQLNCQEQASNFYKKQHFVHKAPFTATLVRTQCDIETQTYPENSIESKALENIKSCEQPHTADLLKIIAQQNEQLLILQRQVAMFLDRDRNYPVPIEARSEQDRQHTDSKQFATVSTPQKNHFRQENTVTKQASIFQDNQRKWGMSKFSINLTTSFDMPIRAQQKQNFFNNEPKIQELTESDFSPKNENPLEQSIRFQEPLHVREQCPSPQPSININMNDYESSDDDISSSEIGTTFYNNLMGQVNNILKKAHMEAEDFKQKGYEGETMRKKTLNKVREATVKHLRTIGITVDDQRDLLPPGNIEHYNPSEISLTVKQLLMKYLPSGQLKQEKVLPTRNEERNGVLEARSEFSLASLEYMRKYNLIPSEEKFPQITSHQKIGQKDQTGNNKRILDLTALKMQPKLL